MKRISLIEKHLASIFGSRPKSPIDPAELQRISQYKEVVKMYMGEHWDHDRDDLEFLVTVNYCETFVDKHAIFLAGKPWTYQNDEGKVSKRVLTFLTDVWLKNDKNIKTYEIAHEMGLLGDSFVLVNLDENKEIVYEIFPAIYVFPEWHPKKRNKMLKATIEYEAIIEGKMAVIKYDIDALQIVEYVDGKEIRKTEHLLGRVPLIHFKNNNVPGQWNGRSDIASVTGVQKHVNDKLTDISDIIAYNASPMTFVMGVRLNDIERGPDKLITGLPVEAKVENIEFKSNMEGSMTHYRNMKRAMHQIASCPEIAFGSVDELRFSNSSGLAMQTLYQPMLDVRAVKLKYFDRGLREIDEVALLYAERHYLMIVTEEEMQSVRHIRRYYPDPLPKDETQILTNTILKAEKGLAHSLEYYREIGSNDPEAHRDMVIKDIESGKNILYNSAHPPQLEENSTGEQSNARRNESESGETGNGLQSPSD